MKVVITGGTGFIGRRIAMRLLERGALAGADGRDTKIDELVLFDNAPPQLALPEDRRLKIVTGDIADAATVRRLIAPGTGSIFHLAAIVSAQAEEDTDIGMRVNLDGTRAVLEAARALGTRPRLVFASSLAVYGGDLPEKVSEAVPLTPQTSYGGQKAIGELLVNDYSRKGYIDGRSLRLPTIIVRPGRPNRAASTFASSIIREPLSGVDVVCPVKRESLMPALSPRRVAEAFEKAHDLPGEVFGYNRALQLPGISPSVGDMVEALRRVAGEAVVRHIKWQPDPVIQKIVDGWPRGVDGSRAEKLGIRADRSFDEIIEAFIADDLPAQKVLVAAGKAG
jgi:nucleoside-diphosphate-sugar epimerase